MTRALGLVAVVVPLSTHTGTTQDGPPGITKPVAFPPFNPDVPDCSRPGCLRKTLTFAQVHWRSQFR